MEAKLLIIILVNFSSFLYVYSEEFSKENQEEVVQQGIDIESALLFSQKNTITEDDANWLRNTLKNQMPKPINSSFLSDDDLNFSNKKQCKNCFKGDLTQLIEQPEVKVFMSFSIPDNIWICLSKNIEKVGGTFVLRGLPQNNFTELADRILTLKKQGVNAQIQIDPMAFREFEITLVPAFVIPNGDKYDKISGNITLEYALSYMNERCENNAIKLMIDKLRSTYE